MVKFDEIISGSLEWTVTVLFRPFSPKKWLILGFVALMAGALMGGNLNLRSGSRDYRVKETKTEELSPQKSIEKSKTPAVPAKVRLKNAIKSYLRDMRGSGFTGIFIGVVFILFIILIIFIWLGARFHFIFLEDVIKNDASIVLPFKSNKGIGNSFFQFNILFLLIFAIVFGLIIFGCILALIKIGAFNQQVSPDFLKILSVILPFTLLLILAILISVFIFIIVEDFALIIMLKDRIKITAAIKKAMAILGANKANFLLYVLIKWGLAICSSIIYGVMYFVTFFGLLFPAVTSASFLYFIYRTIPKNIQSVFLMVIVVMAISILIFLWYCFACMSLPFAVFFRTFSVKFLGRLDNRYDLFKY